MVISFNLGVISNSLEIISINLEVISFNLAVIFLYLPPITSILHFKPVGFVRISTYPNTNSNGSHTEHEHFVLESANPLIQ